MNIESVCVIGGSGFLGRHVVQRLAAAGIRVRVPTRRRERAKRLIVLPTADVVNADVHDPVTLNRLVAGSDAVINLAGILHEQRRGDFARVHTELPRRLVDACREQNVRRLVHVSALKAAHDAPSEYLRSKAGGEQQVRVAHASAIRTTIFRPSVIFGRDDRFLNLFAQLARALPVIMLASPRARFQPVHVEDVAQAIVASLAEPRCFDQSFDLCGPTQAKSEWRNELQPFGGNGRRYRGTLQVEVLEGGVTQLRARVEAQNNKELARPLDPVQADWVDLPDDEARARVLLQHLLALLAASGVSEGGR